jgi:hypothetical protein
MTNNDDDGDGGKIGVVMHSDHSSTRTLAVEELLHTIPALKRGCEGGERKGIV